MNEEVIVTNSSSAETKGNVAKKAIESGFFAGITRPAIVDKSITDTDSDTPKDKDLEAFLQNKTTTPNP